MVLRGVLRALGICLLGAGWAQGLSTAATIESIPLELTMPERFRVTSERASRGQALFTVYTETGLDPAKPLTPRSHHQPGAIHISLVPESGWPHPILWGRRRRGQASGATHIVNVQPRSWADDRRVGGQHYAPSEDRGWPQMSLSPAMHVLLSLAFISCCLLVSLSVS